MPPGDRNQYFRSSGTNHVIAASQRLHYFRFLDSVVMFEFFSSNVYEENCSEFGPANEGAASTGRRHCQRACNGRGVQRQAGRC